MGKVIMWWILYVLLLLCLDVPAEHFILLSFYVPILFVLLTFVGLIFIKVMKEKARKKARKKEQDSWQNLNETLGRLSELTHALQQEAMKYSLLPTQQEDDWLSPSLEEMQTIDMVDEDEEAEEEEAEEDFF